MKNTKNDLTLGSVVALLARIAKLDSEVSALTTERDELRVKLATKDERIAELEKDNNITHENLAWYMAKYYEHLKIIEVLRDILIRYRNETPIGHQPHMIAHEVDNALAALQHKR